MFSTERKPGAHEPRSLVRRPAKAAAALSEPSSRRTDRILLVGVCVRRGQRTVGRMAGVPRLAQGRWPGPVLDERWNTRTRFYGRMLQQGWAAFLGRLPWAAFVTLTFNPKRRFPVSAELADKEAFRWCGLLGYVVRRPVAWLYVVERHASGRWHAHVLIAGASLGAVQGVAAFWKARNGRAHARRVDNSHKAVLYSTKEAALRGEVVLSDTVTLYKPVLGPFNTAELHRASRRRTRSLQESRR